MDKDSREVTVRASSEIEKVPGKERLFPRTRGGWYATTGTGVVTGIIVTASNFDPGVALGCVFVLGAVSSFSDDVLHFFLYGKRFPDHLAMADPDPKNSFKARFARMVGYPMPEGEPDDKNSFKARMWRLVGIEWETEQDPRNNFKARTARMLGLPEPPIEEPGQPKSEPMDDEPQPPDAGAQPATEQKKPAMSGYQLVVNGRVGKDDILLGHDADGKELRRTWKQLKAVLILGLQGGGKTTSACWLMIQALIQGARLAVIDKHAKSEEDSLMQKIGPFTPFFDCSPGVDPDSALQAVKHVKQVFNARLDGAPCSYPLLFVIDEFSAIMSKLNKESDKWHEVAKELAELIEDLNFEGRKHKVYAICIGQATNATKTGGTEIRDLFNTRIVHGMRVKQAQMLSLTEHSKDIRALDLGQAIVDMEGRDEPFFVQVPYVSDEDIRLIAEWLEHEQSIPAPKTQRLELEDLPMKQPSRSKTTLNLDAVLALAGKVSDETLLALIDKLPDVGEDEDEDEMPGEDAQDEPTLLERGIKAYTEGHTTLDALAVALSITTWEARKLMAQVKIALKNV